MDSRHWQSMLPGLLAALVPCALAAAQAVHQSFDNVPALAPAGWVFINHSSPPAGPSWGQGNTGIMAPMTTPGYIAAGSDSTGGQTGDETISNWLLTPVLNLHNGDTVSFWTRAIVDMPVYPDRMQVRLSVAGASTSVGATPTDVGDFTVLLGEINPDLTTTDYPTAWARYAYTLSGIPAGSTGRIGFRYFVTGAGANGAYSDYIGLDEFDLTPAGTCPPNVCAYCPAGSALCSAAAQVERITRFTIGPLDNDVGTGNGPPGCYADFTGMSVTLVRGQCYPVTLLNGAPFCAGPGYSDKAGVWIDWYHDFFAAASNATDFLRLDFAGANDPCESFSGMVCVPMDATLGATRLRARVVWEADDDLAPCGDTFYGSVQDYTAIVVDPSAGGVCCRGATCSMSVAQADCATPAGGSAGAVFVGGATACNGGASTTSPCCEADYNKVSRVTVQDIFDFLHDWFAGSPFARFGGDGTGGPTVQSIFDYLSAWFAGCA